MPSRIYTAPPNTGVSRRGETLPALLYEACRRFNDPWAFNQPTGDGWKAYSHDLFRRYVEETAAGLLALGLERGDRVAFYLDSDVYFCIADLGCLLAGIVDVPIYLSSVPDAVQYVIRHAGAKAVFAADVPRLHELAPVLPQTPDVQFVVLASGDAGEKLPELPPHIEVLSFETLRERGGTRFAEESNLIERMKGQLDPHDLATIIYTSGTTGQPKGVMLTHENISHNALTAFSGMKGYREGPDGEIVFSFLPLTHIFARTLYYGAVYHGNRLYFTTPERLIEDLQKQPPTLFATVPRVLEKVYGKIQERTEELEGVQRLIGRWALQVAQRYELGAPQTPLYVFQRWLADVLVYRKWRAVLGGNIRYIICGGAALHPEITNVFAAAGLTILQGYGLTETSPVITFNRPHRNRAGTVGEPIPDVEVRLADDGEILTRGPHVMQGYFKDPEKTREVLDDEGWLHTGDIGQFTGDGFLKITDRKKDLFKLSTGKYVMPQPLENRLGAEALIEQAVVVGAGQPFCAALIFPEQDTLRVFANHHGLDADAPIERLLREPVILRRYEELARKANEGMDPWSTIKRFALIPDHLTIENGMLTPTLKVKRPVVHQRYGDDIRALYDKAQNLSRGYEVAVS